MPSGYRYLKVPGSDNRYVVPKKEISNPDYASTITVSPDAEDTIVEVAQLTGDATINVETAASYTGDKLKLILTNDGTVRTVTFGTGLIVATSTIELQESSQAIVEFTYVYAVSAWVETNRTNYL